MKRIFLLAAAALISAGCASNTTRDGMVYRDGSWYSPADDGRGDYYTSAQRSYYGNAYDYPFDFGIGLVPYGGYCPVQYRWCTSYWPYYDPYWYQPWVYYQHQPRRHRNRQASIVGYEPGEDESLPLPRTGEARERSRPETWQERPVHGPRSGSGSGEGRRRRGSLGGSSPIGGG